MGPKQKKAKHEKSGKKRTKTDSESSSPDPFAAESDQGGSMSSTPMPTTPQRATRASARACKAKNRDSWMMEATLKAHERSAAEVPRCNYDFNKLRTSDAYVQPSLYTLMEPEDFNMDYYNRTGLNQVLMFSCPPEKLGMKMVDENFTVRDVEKLVGGDKMITCVEVATQTSKDFPLSKFIEYYYLPKEEKKILYNVLSLEFSNTALTDLVQSPSLVREIDWASTWPDERKVRSVTFDKDGRFTITNHFPRVENYCLMSPTECYTDFHIDFHGTSVWYHVKKGMKIFWIIEPTEQNLKLYEEYLKAANHDYFFGDVPEKCARVEVKPGCTLIIPSGWIHAVFTPCDSLVFGGNFLHSRGAIMQLNVLQGENRIGINKKYRYPYSEEVVFFHLNHILKKVTGRDYIRPESRNQQDEYREYIGKLFEQQGGHRRIPKAADYEDNGIAWQKQWEETKEYEESQVKLAKWDKKEEEEKNGEDVKKEEEEIKKEEMEEEMEVENKEKVKEDCGGHDDFFVDDFTLYHPKSFNLDAGVGATAMHTLPLSQNEPKIINIDQAALRQSIHPSTIPPLEGLLVHYLKRPKVDLPIGLTRPNSLLQAFCTLLRERRRLAEEEGVGDLPSCILPDKDGSRRLHEEQKAAAEERRRKYEEKRERLENGDDDSDWDPQGNKPKSKKAKRADEGIPKTADGVEVKKEKKEKKENEKEKEGRRSFEQRIGTEGPKNIWNAAFNLWYKREAGPAVEKHKTEFPVYRELKEYIRKHYFTPLDKDKKHYWMEETNRLWKEKYSSPSLASPLKTPSDQSLLSTSSSSSQVDGDEEKDTNGLSSPGPSGVMVKKEEESPVRAPSAPTSSAPQSTPSGVMVPPPNGHAHPTPSPMTHPPSSSTPLIPTLISTPRTSQLLSFPSGMNGGEKMTPTSHPGISLKMTPTSHPGMTPTSHPGISLATSSNNALVQAMQQKFALEGRLKGSAVSKPKIDSRISEEIVRNLTSKQPEFPRLLDFTNSVSLNSTPDVLEHIKNMKRAFVKVMNEICHSDLTVGDIEDHITNLNTSALRGDHLNGQRIPFLTSIKMVADAFPFTLVPQALISVKPPDQSLLKQSTPKTSPLIARATPEKKNVVVEKEESVEVKKETEGKSENGEEKKKEIQSDFREAKAEPKPPEGREGRMEEDTAVPSTSSLPPIEEVREKKDRMEREESLPQLPNSPKMKPLANKLATGMEMGSPLSRRSTSVYEKEEEMEDDLFSNDGSSAGSSRKPQREDHWDVMKRVAEGIGVKKYTESYEDWTPFDAFLRRNYEELCINYEEEPSNEFVLKIRRDLYDDLAKEDGAIRWELDAARFIREKRKRIYWMSETVVKQEDPAVEDKGVKTVPLGGEELKEQETKNEDEYLVDEEEELKKEDDEMIDVEGVEDDIPLAASEDAEPIVKEESMEEAEKTPKKKGKGGRPKKELTSDKKKKPREPTEDFMQSGTTPRGKGKKAKPDPNKPLIVDGVLVNPLAKPAIANAYGYDPAMDLVPLGQGQLKSAYRRSRAQLDTPQIDAKRYKLEVKHDHLLDDDDHDDTHRDDAMEGMERTASPHAGGEIMEGINVNTGDPSTVSPPHSSNDQQQPSPFHLNPRSSSFSRRPVQPAQQAPPPLIPHAPSPLAARRISGAAVDGWRGVSSGNGGRRRSDGERRERTSMGGRSPPRKPSSHISPVDAPHTPSTPSTPANSSLSSTPSAIPSSSNSSKETRLSQLEQFNMAAPKVIDAPRLAAPVVATPIQSYPDTSHSRMNSLSGEEPLPMDVFCSELERVTADLERANAVMASSANGN